jgi:iron(III) transport system substrate-binding protein
MIVSRRSVLAGAAALAASAALRRPAHAAPAGVLHLYTSQPNDQLVPVQRAFAALYPGVKLEVFRSGTTEVVNKLQAEFAAGSPQADVILLADAVAATQLKNDGRLLAYKDAPVSRLPKALIDADMMFFGTKFITTGIVYNTKLVQSPPRRWNDLLKPEAARLTTLPSPLYSGAAAIHVGTMTALPEYGWAYFEQLAKGGALSVRANGAVVEAVARGERAYGMLIDYMAFNAKKAGSPVDFVFPEDGVTIITQPVAILKTSKNVEAAKAFVNWQMTDEAQKQSVSQGYYPVFADIAPPKGYPPLSSLKVLTVDPAKLVAGDEAMKQRFADLFG